MDHHLREAVHALRAGPVLGIAEMCQDTAVFGDVAVTGLRVGRHVAAGADDRDVRGRIPVRALGFQPGEEQDGEECRAERIDLDVLFPVFRWRFC